MISYMVRTVLTKHKDEAWGYLENYRGTSNSGSWEERWKLQNVGVNSSKIHLKKMYLTRDHVSFVMKE